MKKLKNNNSGFTLIEAMITLSILSGLLIIGTSDINKAKARNELKTTANQIVSTLQVSQNKAISSSNGNSSSVCFKQANNTYKIISGNDCNNDGIEYNMNKNIFFEQIVLDAENKVEFKKLIGNPIYPGKIIIKHKHLPNKKIIINISEKGVITIL